MIQEMIEENLSSGEQIKTKTKFREHHRIPENFPHSLYSLSKHYSPILLAPSPPLALSTSQISGPAPANNVLLMGYVPGAKGAATCKTSKIKT